MSNQHTQVEWFSLMSHFRLLAIILSQYYSSSLLHFLSHSLTEENVGQLVYRQTFQPRKLFIELNHDDIEIQKM